MSDCTIVNPCSAVDFVLSDSLFLYLIITTGLGVPTVACALAIVSSNTYPAGDK